ncbi:hypothetical protein, partial [Roseibium sediminis]|uniref:hypothetical protein n=1 Tax=Roseibium sediminis TaxID=1775174 RepID=UPI001375C4E4
EASESEIIQQREVFAGVQLRRPKIRTAHPHLSIANHDVIIQPGFERKNQRVIQQPANAHYSISTEF